MEKHCPIYKEPCHEYTCEWYIHIVGKHPQSDSPIDHWGCAISWLPVLQIEGNQRMNQLGGSIDSFRNEMSRQNEEMLELTDDKRERLLNG